MFPSLATLQFAPYFEKYVGLLQSDDLTLELSTSAQQVQTTLVGLEEDQWSYRYEPDKWSIKEVLYHIIETEFIFNYRAITIARENSKCELPGFDEKRYIDQSDLSGLANNELLGLLNATRNATIMLSKTFTEEQFSKTGVASGHEVQVKSLFYITAGHTYHHLNVIKQRYLS